jgi:hypothetical protein
LAQLLARLNGFCYSPSLKIHLENLNLRSPGGFAFEKGILLWEAMIIGEILATVCRPG